MPKGVPGSGIPLPAHKLSCGNKKDTPSTWARQPRPNAGCKKQKKQPAMLATTNTIATAKPAGPIGIKKFAQTNFWLFLLAICDDPCTLVQHIEHRDGTIAELAYGETKGCFEKPSHTKKPTKDIDCPDILPLAHQQNQNGNQSLMDNPSTLLHPDVVGSKRYIMGTRLQMRKSGKSHKKQTCSFHDISLANQGGLVKSMNQEALQVTR